MVKAERVHGNPTMVSAMMIAASTQASAITNPPHTSHRRLRNSVRRDMALPWNAQKLFQRRGRKG